jgi:hypothetical protein
LFALWREEGSTKTVPPSIMVDENGISWTTDTNVRIYDITITDEAGSVILNRSVPNGNVDIIFNDYAPGIYYITVLANANSGEEDNSSSYYTFVNKGLSKVDGFFVTDSNVLVFNGVENAEKYLITVVCGNSDHCHTDFDNGDSKAFSLVSASVTEVTMP